MPHSAENPDPDQEKIVTTEDAVTKGTAPDADTQSSAASEAGDRTPKTAPVRQMPLPKAVNKYLMNSNQLLVPCLFIDN